MTCTLNINLNISSTLFSNPYHFTRTCYHNPRLPTPVNFFGNHVGRRRLSANVSSSELPLLPFDINQVLVPSESKTLHLYEARFLALLEESLFKKKKFFVHFVLDPIAISGSSVEASFAATCGCLVFIENIERLDVGALVSIRGIGRVKIVKFLQATKESLLQTRIANSLTWAEKEPSEDCDEAFVPSLAERVSFAALQPVSGSSRSELVMLQREKVRAMDVNDTLRRLEDSLKLVKNNISMVAAKLAIQSLNV